MSVRRAFRPRHVVHRGTVAARAVLVDGSLRGHAVAQRRVLGLWSPGTTVHRLGTGWLVILPAPRRLSSATAEGTLLVEASGALVAFPVASGTGDPPSLPPGCVARYQAGALDVEPLASAPLVSPASWLDLRGFRVAVAESLGAPPAPPTSVFAPPAPFDPRVRFQGVPEAAAERAALLAGLEDSAARRGRVGGGRREGGFAKVLRWIGLALERARAGSAGRERRAGAAAPAREDGWRSRFADGLNRILTRALLLTRLSSFVGRRQAEYLARLVDMLEGGDVENGLRHAIPVDGPEGERIRQALGIPTPRRDLKLSPFTTRATSAIGIDEDFTAYLRRLYRSTYERLAAQGRIDEAAFVLAELLHANEEAVAFLERNGRLLMAAEMAEARELPPGLVVRQWFVAGRADRAVEIARRRGAFGDAVLRLEQQQRHEHASALRLLWADALASEGDYRAAVDVAWAVPAGRRLAAAWIDRVVEQGGPAGAAMLVRRLSLDPDSLPEIRTRAVAIAEDERADGVATRLALAEALAAAPEAPGRAILARVAARAALRDAGLFGTRLTTEVLRKLVGADGALRTDLPSLPRVARDPLVRTARPFLFRVAAGDVGALPVRDVGLLPNGRMVVALGEAGVLLRSRENKLLARFDVPADRLVLADAGDRAIALARRGEAWRLARLDLVRLTAEDWCDARIDAFAPTYDGARWFVATEDLWAIDVQGSRFDASWRVPGIAPGRSAEVVISRSRTRCGVYVPPQRELWSYELPALVLRSRRDVPGEHKVCAVGLAATNVVAAHGQDPASVFWTSSNDRWNGEAEARVDERSGPVVLNETWIAAAWIGAEGSRILLCDVATGTSRAHLHLAGAESVALRLDEGALVVGDDRGRVLALDLDQGWLIRDVRL